MKILGVVDGSIKPEEIKLESKSTEAKKQTSNSHARMTAEERKIYDELLGLEAKLVPESITYLKDQVRSALELRRLQNNSHTREFSEGPDKKLEIMMRRLS